MNKEKNKNVFLNSKKLYAFVNKMFTAVFVISLGLFLIIF